MALPVEGKVGCAHATLVHVCGRSYRNYPISRIQPGSVCTGTARQPRPAVTYKHSRHRTTTYILCYARHQRPQTRRRQASTPSSGGAALSSGVRPAAHSCPAVANCLPSAGVWESAAPYGTSPTCLTTVHTPSSTWPCLPLRFVMNDMRKMPTQPLVLILSRPIHATRTLLAARVNTSSQDLHTMSSSPRARSCAFQQMVWVLDASSNPTIFINPVHSALRTHLSCHVRTHVRLRRGFARGRINA